MKLESWCQDPRNASSSWGDEVSAVKPFSNTHMLGKLRLVEAEELTDSRQHSRLAITGEPDRSWPSP